MNDADFSKLMSPAQEFKVMGKLKPVKYRKQAMPRCHIELKIGKQIKDGAQVWTTNSIYFYDPNMHHTGKITFGLYNGSGRAFVQLLPHEFDEWLQQIIEWRKVNFEQIEKLAEANNIIASRQQALKHAEMILSDPKSKVEELMPNYTPDQDKTLNEITDHTIRIIDKLSKSTDSFAKDIYVKLIKKNILNLNSSQKHLNFVKEYMEEMLSSKYEDILKSRGVADMPIASSKQDDSPAYKEINLESIDFQIPDESEFYE